MFRNTLLLMTIGIIVITGWCYAIQVDGYCYLENQQYHEGTKVLFQAQSPTAVTDSTYTDTSGYYQIDIPLGVYDISFSHDGYLTEELSNQLLSQQTTLPNITLIYIHPGVNISGALSGVFTDTTYIVEGNIWVNDHDSLTIEPGAIFLFMGDHLNLYEFEIQGYLNAVGTETDSIKFIPAPGVLYWRGLQFLFSDDSSQLEYCLVSGCFGNALHLFFASPTIKHCNFSSVNDDAIECYDYSSPIIMYCNIEGTDYFHSGLSASYNSLPTMSYCKISGYQIGIEALEYSHPNISYCTIADNLEAGMLSDGSSSPSISNCTISGSNYGIQINGTTVTIKNSIIENCEFGINFYNTPNVSVIYCDFYNNSDSDFAGNTVPSYLGQLITTNGNGDSCDVYYNIFKDPIFVDPNNGDYHLQAGSPCIDAGDPTSPLDPDGTVADIGAFYFNQLGISDPKQPPNQPSDFCLYQNYPNPFNASTVIKYTLPQPGKTNLAIYNILGQEVTTLIDRTQQPGTHSIIWDAPNLPSGIYFARLKCKNFAQAQKMLLLK